tara:strand:+ start:99255 stop:99356 length:102 start_codon:yes stop_codon:yes gene_type:complete
LCCMMASKIVNKFRSIARKLSFMHVAHTIFEFH